jgi:hypothetical protein
VSGQYDHNHLGRARIDPAEQRRRLAELAAAIAGTEDRVADTLERMAVTRPHEAAGLKARATQARQNAAVERNRATMFSLPASRAVPASRPSPQLEG